MAPQPSTKVCTILMKQKAHHNAGLADKCSSVTPQHATVTGVTTAFLQHPTTGGMNGIPALMVTLGVLATMTPKLR
jgi:hypothetical protein